jgi:hypothetical protein
MLFIRPVFTLHEAQILIFCKIAHYTKKLAGEICK